jgi:cell division protein FtsB
MTANQFHNLKEEEIEDYVREYIEEFRRYSYGLISDEHTLKHYKIKGACLN